MQPLSRYQVDHLLLLIGTNPLPNYVAAKLLARDPETTVLWLIHSADTTPARDALERELRADGFQRFQSVPVEESNPANIRTEVMKCASKLDGLVGLNYTGGTKAMAVHAYRALEARSGLRVQYSYLDPRTLMMQVEGDGIPTSEIIANINQSVRVPLARLLALHDLARFNKQMSREIIWERVQDKLLDAHADPASAAQWRAWCQNSFRKQDAPNKWVNTTTLKGISTDTIPLASVRAALEAEYPAATFPLSFEELAAMSPFGKAIHSLAKWFDGVWLEQYVFRQLRPLLQTGAIGDLAMTLNPVFSDKDKEKDPPEFEFDVACTRGYQLFACSVTSSDDEKLCKSKLIEALVRAEQLGGSEARIALICCYDRPSRLRDQISKLFHQTRCRIFGREDLRDLGPKLAAWIAGPSRTQEGQ